MFALASPLELPLRRRAFEVAMLDAKRPNRPDTKARVHRRVQHLDLVVRLVLGILEREQLGDVRRINQQLGGTLDHDRVQRILGRDDAPRVDSEVLRLARRLAAAEPECAVVPYAPHRHRMRTQIGPHGHHPVVTRGDEPLLGPRPGQKAAAFGRRQGAIARHVWTRGSGGPAHHAAAGGVTPATSSSSYTGRTMACAASSPVAARYRSTILLPTSSPST